MIELNPCLEIAKSAALAAGNFLKQSQGTELKILFNEGRDIKLQLDLDAENIIRKYIDSKSSFAILGEETGFSKEKGEFYWVVDPLDGTSNYLNGIPISCVAIALMQNLNPILGVIYDFNHNDLYCGHVGSSAFLNDKKIAISSTALKKESTLVTGIPAKTNYSDYEFLTMIKDFQAWKKIRMIGSAAMASAYVASGKAEMYKENGIFLWDIAAGAAIVSAAGGIVSIENFQSDFRVDVKFSNTELKK